ncbi:glycine/sarcosine/betaine reductase component B subunit [Sansalvadorimonas sp. 2012CJ34-2]|uniref:Glycine/sarcosine/betaine reductase component B subunit n=1 Tax=Parendozoicomonas callyspongiae TaxID=2942213 RepID=A0ABT0PD05_9GAMM|nr:glycine/sarcosine/betaine reductase component B subunit [Sansalvadorimonas sp. 2012CJ34-2]MCL6269250.1 glycine/sarcosine/betaine reductase component B subunit [Sansalvadorimonas sp. 2012CJ34-2]
MGIGPSTKETTLHHFRDPILDVVSRDADIDLLGVVVVGTPQVNEEKYFVGKRTATWIEAMRADGVIFSVDGWGNSHVDYENTFREIGQRGIPAVGLSFIGTQARFVVENEYMDTVVDINKNQEGIETEVVGENSLVNLDARKALALLKLKMKLKMRKGNTK